MESNDPNLDKNLMYDPGLIDLMLSPGQAFDVESPDRMWQAGHCAALILTEDSTQEEVESALAACLEQLPK